LLRLLALALLVGACGGGHGQGQGPAYPPPALPSVGTATYELVWEQTSGELRATAALPAGLTASLDVELRAAPYIVDAVVEHAGQTRALVRTDDGFAVPECMNAACVLRYRVKLREAARALSDLDSAKLLDPRGDVVSAPPPTFILAPWGGAAATKVRFRVTTSAGSSFLTGVFPACNDMSSCDPSRAGFYETTMEDFGSSPYSAFGPLTLRTVKVTGSQLEVGLVPGPYPLPESDLLSWVEASGRAVSSYYGGLPVPREAVLLVPAGGGGIGFGKSLAGGGVTVFVGVGVGTTKKDLAEDWVLTHELIHAAFPAQPRELDWVEEGLATYVEPLARARVGALPDQAVWKGMLDGLHFGLPEAGDRGIDHTHTWGRVYWGGALFFFLADLEIRKQTQGKVTLREALMAILRQVSSNAHRGDLAHAFHVGDQATGTHVLTSLHASWSSTPVMVDLETLYASLGVRTSADDRTVVFDDSAPLAELRRSLTSRAQ
jgi:hypothetical protein